MKIQKIQETVLLRLLEKSQANKDDPYGEYLFAPQRKDLKGKKEKNTPEEDELLKAFQDHYNNEEYTLGNIAPEILDLISQGKYSKVLAPPPGPYYRLLAELPVASFANFLGVKAKSLRTGEVSEGGSGTMIPGGRYSGSTGIHSWTTKLDPKWANKDILVRKFMKPGEVIAIIVADESGGDFFVNPKGMSNVKEMPKYVQTQNEVISYGSVSFENCVYYIATGKKGEPSSHEIFKQLLEII